MIEKKIEIKDVELSYFDNEVEGQTIVLIHGNSLQARLFYKQFKSVELSKYRILALDLPGHGMTSATEHPEKDYSVRNYIDLIIEFIKTLRLDNLVLYGHSLGGHIAIHVVDEISEVTIKGIVISGTPPFTIPPKLDEAFLPNPAIAYAFKPDLSEEESEQLASFFCNNQIEDYDLVKKSIISCDPLLRPFIGKSISTDLVTDESLILKKTKASLAVLHGKNDNNVNREYIERLTLPLWKNKIIEIEDAGHSPFLENPKAFNRILENFLDEMS